MVITNRGPDSRYKVQVILSACVNGYLDARMTHRVSLILVEYRAVFSSIDTSFEFQTYPPDPNNLAPQVATYAPFKEPMRLNYSTAQNLKSTISLPSSPRSSPAPVPARSRMAWKGGKSMSRNILI